MKIVEQVDIEGNTFMDYDTSLSPRALYDCIFQSFPSIYTDEDGMICGEYKNKRFAIRVKNITYLGHPHPLSKKRIQISNDLKDFYNNALKKRRTPILLGVYSCVGNTLFCDFNIDDYINKKAHNSSAHVSTNDLAEGAAEGYFYKEDAAGNKITIFTKKTTEVFLEEKLGLKLESDSYEYRFDDMIEHEIVADAPLQYNMEKEIEKIERIVSDFLVPVPRKWYGLECYEEMITAEYKNRFQPEWPGFYLEYLFENYINHNKLTNIVKYAQDKSKDGIDLDLFFPGIHMYGDLKAHSNNSSGIQGNDWKTVLGIINNPKRDSHIYYIVFEHETEKDSDHNFEVTNYWNAAQGKENLMSYSKRMKNNIELTHAYIFDINSNNKRYLSKFKQGLNSNGKPREPKIMIERDCFEEFVLVEYSL